MLIGLQNLEKDFGEAVILKGITANVEQGDRIGIVGENGAGKTTLLRMLCGEYQPDAGELTIVHGVTLGYLEQNSKLDPALDVYGEMRKAFQPVLDAMARMQVVEKQLALHPEADGHEELLEEHARLSAVVDAADGYNMDPPAAGKIAAAAPGCADSGRAHQPSGFCHDGMAGKLPERLFWRCAGGQP